MRKPLEHIRRKLLFRPLGEWERDDNALKRQMQQRADENEKTPPVPSGVLDEHQHQHITSPLSDSCSCTHLLPADVLLPCSRVASCLFAASTASRAGVSCRAVRSAVEMQTDRQVSRQMAKQTGGIGLTPVSNCICEKQRRAAEEKWIATSKWWLSYRSSIVSTTWTLQIKKVTVGFITHM